MLTSLLAALILGQCSGGSCRLPAYPAYRPMAPAFAPAAPATFVVVPQPNVSSAPAPRFYYPAPVYAPTPAYRFAPAPRFAPSCSGGSCRIR
jgi:hypothetical protein